MPGGGESAGALPEAVAMRPPTSDANEGPDPFLVYFPTGCPVKKGEAVTWEVRPADCAYLLAQAVVSRDLGHMRLPSGPRSADPVLLLASVFLLSGCGRTQQQWPPTAAAVGRK